MTSKKLITIAFLGVLFLFFTGCATAPPKPVIETGSAEPGGKVARKGAPLHLIGTPVSVGHVLPSALLVDAENMQDIDLSKEKGSVLLLSIVPSIDTKVCEVQTHYLGEEGADLPEGIRKITISRDTPFAQKRFANEAKLNNIRYLSDYKKAEFGQATGLLIDELRLLARSVMVVDQNGIVRHLQVVPEITHLPDMQKAFQFAIDLNKQSR